MANRKKRLKKGIDSLSEQLKLHEIKLKKAEKDGNIGLASYYKKELAGKKKDFDRKKRMLEKGG
ncbi:hypothetical protein HYV81_03010 [Candidatus Woesearchaeota archaeon]|nr:hypothetical protein [Candidatus Woesearchaeota archaeon]